MQPPGTGQFSNLHLSLLNKIKNRIRFLLVKIHFLNFQKFLWMLFFDDFYENFVTKSSAR